MRNAARNYMQRVPGLGKAAARYRSRGLTSSDVLLASYPKSGNTWAKQLIVQLLTSQTPDFDFAESVVPLLGEYERAPRVLPGNGRLLKSHTPYDKLYPWKFGKAVYLVRDGRDVAVSYYYHCLRSGKFHGSFADFLAAYLTGGLLDTYGTWHHHIDVWLNSPLNERDDLLVLHYETLLSNTSAALRQMSTFLGIEATDEQLMQAIDNNTADKMRGREQAWKGIEARGQRRNSDIPFVRSAKAGDWRQHFSRRDLDTFNRSAGPAMRLLGYTNDEQ